MPVLGEVRKGSEIGSTRSCRFIWHACPQCGKERWVRYIREMIEGIDCPKCHMTKLNKILSGEKNPRWAGGRQIITGGYYEVYLSNEDPLSSMARSSRTKSGGYVREHRLIMGRHLGRCLEDWEIVHHLNGIRTDNRRENLTIVDRHSHQHDTVVKRLQEKIRLLEDELKLIREEKK